MKFWKRMISFALALVMAMGITAALAPQARAENDGPSCLHWVSGWAYGSESYCIPQGQPAYVCYELYTDSTGTTKFNDAYSYDYTAVVTIYRPDGTVATTSTVNNDDEYWINFKTSKLGTYTYEIVFSGQLYGTFTGSYTVYDPDDSMVRLAGDHRWATSLKVAHDMKAHLDVDKFDAVIIASGNDFADALAGSYLSTVKNAPILLSWGKGGNYAYLDEDNISYIKSNLAEGGTVYILGGENAVPSSYEEALADYNVKRLGGADRFETNLLILEEAGVNAGEEVLVCTSTNFADSLSASATGKPILLVFNESGMLYGRQPEYLASLSGCTFTIIGGENAVCPALEEAISAYGITTRLAGSDRFETSVMVAETYFDAPETAVLAYAWNYPDGLCGGALAYSMDAPLILTMTNYELAAAAYIQGKGIGRGMVLGGDSLISNESVWAIFNLSADDVLLIK